MAKGTLLPGESILKTDTQTGVSIRQITTHQSTHHHPFYYIPAFDRDMRWLCFVSHRTGSPQIYVEGRSNGQLVQLTDRNDLNEWSIHPSADGRFVYFTTTTGGWRIEIETLREEQLLDFVGGRKAEGMVGAGMGTTSVSHDDRYWAIPLKRDDQAELIIVDIESGQSSIAIQNRSVGHPQFHPSNNNLIRYGGPYDERIWITERDGSNHRLIYERNIDKKEWIVHECWWPGTDEILTVNWPHGVMAIDINSRETRWVTEFNAWHPIVNPDGTFMITDTKSPDIGLQRFELTDGLSEPRLVCATNSSNQGDHWNLGYCPYDDGPINVHAPQHTHPHPNISPDGKTVVFTSDESGFSQIYEVNLHEISE